MRAAAALTALLLGLGPGIAIAGDQGLPDWRSKADEPLLQAMAGGLSPLTMVVQGPVLPEPEVMPVSRDAWRAHWALHSAAFLGSLKQQVARLGGEVTLDVQPINAAFVRVPSEAVPELLAREDVRRAGLDWLGATRVLDEGPGLMVKLNSTILKVEATEMWDLGFRGDGVKLAMIDTGIRSTHETLKFADGTTRVAKWYDATSAGCTTPCDTHGHGTHVTSTSAGSNLFNAGAPQGVAPRAVIFGVKIFIGGGGTWEDAQEGLQAAFDLGAEVTSNSWGGGCSGGGVTTAELAETLQNAGMMNVFAAGNSGSGGVICPGMVDNVITVGAIDINEAVAGFSSRGPCTWPVGSGNTRTCPDVMAVGVAVEAASISCDTCYISMDGTSMATPHVAGVVALLQQARIALKGAGFSAKDKEAEILLRYTAKDLGTPGPDNDFGFGLAKAKQAYDTLANPAALNLKDLFSNGKPVLRSYETNNLLFSVANLGAVQVSGHLTHKVEQVSFGPCPPTCDKATITDKDLALDPIREAVSSYAFKGSDHPAGTYLVTATYSFTYVDPADGLTKSGELSRSGTFLVKKVAWNVLRPAGAVHHTGDVLLDGGLVLRNVGNENASAVKLRELFNPRVFAPLPVAPPGLGPYGAFANPAPDNVNLLRRFDATAAEYRWDNIGEVKSGTQWVAKMNFLVAQPGVDLPTLPTLPRLPVGVAPPGDIPETHVFKGVLTYNDETGRNFIELHELVSVVTVPPAPQAPPLPLPG